MRSLEGAPAPPMDNDRPRGDAPAMLKWSALRRPTPLVARAAAGATALGLAGLACLMWPSRAARAVEAAHARTMAGGRQVSVLHGEGARAVVVRLPGRLVRRGDDVLLLPEVIAAPDALALMPDGAWAIDARGNLFDASSAAAVAACRRRPCVAQTVAGHGRVVQVTARGAARLEDGALARRAGPTSFDWRVEPSARRVVDLDDRGDHLELQSDGNVFVRTTEGQTTLALGVRDPQELVRGGGLICARGRRGEVRCGSIAMDGDCMAHALRGSLARVPPMRVAQLTFGIGNVCAVGFDGRLSCASTRDTGDARTLPATVPVPGLGAVAEVALSVGVTCARLRGGEVRCWGGSLDHGGVVRRDAPVPIAGLDAVERLVPAGLRMYALQRGELLCWGGWPSPTGVLEPVAFDRPVTELASAGLLPCVVLAGGAIRCADNTPKAPPWREPEGAAPVGAHSLACTRRWVFVLDEQSRAWFAELGDGHLAFRPLPALDGFERIVDDGNLVCAVRGSDLRCPRADDPSRINAPWWEADWQRELEEVRAAIALTVPVAGALVLPLWRGRRADAADVAEADGALRALLTGGVRATPRPASDLQCLLGVAGRVACRSPSDPREDPDVARVLKLGQASLVPGLDDAVELAVNHVDLACARRASGRVVCWGRNGGGVLTAVDHPEHDRRYRLDELLAR